MTLMRTVDPPRVSNGKLQDYLSVGGAGFEVARATTHWLSEMDITPCPRIGPACA